MADVTKDVLAIIAAKASAEPESLELSARLADLNIASLDVVEIIFALEEKFDVQIPFNANSAQKEFETVGDVVGAVDRLVNGKAGAV